MSASSLPVLDRYGRALFLCRVCGEALTSDDFFTLGLRIPEYDETRDDYCAAELLDDVEHELCGRSGRGR